jgi:uncharacterized protein involved in exopolysaccharide biosynthesis
VVRLILLRLSESYFRRRFMYLLPVLLLLMVSIFLTVTAKPAYIARGAIYVQRESLLTSLTAIQTSGFTWVTPAQATVDELKELIQTDSFIRAIIAQTDLEPVMSHGDEEVRRLIEDTRKDMWAHPLGNNLIQVAAVNEDSLIAEQITTALIEAYVQWKINSDREESISAQGFFEALVQDYKVGLEDALQDQQIYLIDHPDPLRGTRPTIEQVQLNRLQAAVTEAGTRLTNAIDKLDSAKLALAQSESKARQTYLVLDTPDAPAKPESSRKKMAINAALMTMGGVILGGVGVVGAALLDSSYRFPIDVQNSLDLPVLAVVPDGTPRTKPKRGRRRRREAKE